MSTKPIPKSPNQLSSRTERMRGVYHLPISKSITAYFAEQERLTQAFFETLASTLTPDTLTLCRVIRYHQGQLIVTVENQTFINQLNYLKPSLMDTLSKHPLFRHLSCLSFVYTKPN